jgi:AraC-like DNA-binding protein
MRAAAISSSLSSAGATLPLWPPLLATRGEGGASGWHAHHAMHLVVALEGTLRARIEGEPFRATAGVLTAPDVRHSIDARGATILLVFLDPESDAGSALRAAFEGRPLRPLSAAERDALSPGRLDPAAIMHEGGVAFSRTLAARLGAAVPPARRIHPRVRKVLRHLQSATAGDDTSLETLATVAGLSPGRLMHAFTESIGLPLRPYLLWCKLQRAAAGIVAGLPLAQAAALAGFADSAHMARGFRRMFGMSPSMLRPGPRSA